MALLNAFNSSLPPDVRLMNATTGLLLAGVAVGLASLAVMWVVRQPLFVVRSISIEGDIVRNSVPTIRANAAPRLSGNFFTMDLGEGRRAFESVPWVRQAVLNRIWPNRLAVRLQEHRAAALWSRDGAEDKLINTFGEVFEANLGDVEDEALPTLMGPDGSSAHMLVLLNRLRPVLAPMQAQIDTLALSGRGSWRVELDTGAELELGRGSADEIVERTQRFVATVGQVISRYDRPLEYADLRHNEAYAVRLRGVSTTHTTGPATAPRGLSGIGSGPRRGDSRRQPRRRRGRVAGPHNEPATTDGAANHPGPKGWAGKGAQAALQMLAVPPARLRFAPCPHPLAGPTRARPNARQAPRK